MITCHKHFLLLSSFMTCRRVCITRITRRVPLVEQELLTLPGAPEIILGFSGIFVTRSLVFCVVFYRSLFVRLSFFSFGHCVVCPSPIYGFWYPFGICNLLLPPAHRHLSLTTTHPYTFHTNQRHLFWSTLLSTRMYKHLYYPQKYADICVDSKKKRARGSVLAQLSTIRGMRCRRSFTTFKHFV